MTKTTKCPKCGMRAYLGENSIVCKCGYTFIAKKRAALCPICKAKAARAAWNNIITTTCFSCGYTSSKHIVPKGRLKKG